MMDRAKRKELTRQVRIALADPRKLAKALGLVDAASEKQARGIIVRCPAHTDRGRANLSITLGSDGTARCKCHACGYSGDALSLVATVHGLDMGKNFPQVVLLGAELSGNEALRAELEDGKPRPDRIALPEPESIAPAQYPENIGEFWDDCKPIDTDRETCLMLTGRGFDVSRVQALNLCRVLPRGALPEWARYGKRSWRQTGHRMVVRAFDGTGQLRSVRAWRVTDGDSPKRLPPCGHKASGLVLANRIGWGLFSGYCGAGVLFVVEGEPDWLAATLAAPGGHAVIGIGSGSWTSETGRVVSKVRRVIVATHPDDAGDRYANEVIRGVSRAVRWRPQSDLDQLVDLQHHMGIAAKWNFVPHQFGD